MTVDEAEQIIEEIDDMINDELSEEAFHRAPDFFEDISEKSKSVGETIASSGYVTGRQAAALRSWYDGVSRWIKD